MSIAATSPTPPASSAFARAFREVDEAPRTTDEIELKFTANEAGHLRALLTELVARGLTSEAFYRLNPEPFYRRPENNPGILETHPVSWYLDDAEQSLHGSGSDLRMRLTPYLSSHIEWGVKGNSRRFDGIAGARRHEDETVTHSMHEQPFFPDPDTAEMLAPVRGKQLYYWLATDVERRMVGIPVVLESGQRALFEISADPIRFVGARTGTVIHVEMDLHGPGIFEIRPPHDQLEIEYFNPRGGSAEMQALARQLSLDPLTMNEIAEAAVRLRETVFAVAGKIGVDLREDKVAPEEDGPHADEGRSKAGIGFQAYNQNPDLSRPPNLVPAPYSF